MDKYTGQVELAKKHKKLYHYTTIESFREIAKNQSLRLSRMDLVNDSNENERLSKQDGMCSTDLWYKKIYLLCFTYEQCNENYMWDNYNADVRITFNIGDFNPAIAPLNVYSDRQCCKKFSISNRRSDLNHKSYSNADDWEIFDTSLLDVKYCELGDSRAEVSSFLPGGCKYRTGINVKTKKEQEWWREYETRLRVAFKPKGVEYNACIKTPPLAYHTAPFKNVYIKLPPIVEIKIAPNASLETKAEVFRIWDETRTK